MWARCQQQERRKLGKKNESEYSKKQLENEE